VTLPEVRLAPPATIEGTVVDAQQRPLPGVRVWLDWEPERNQRGGTIEEVVTDRLGRYRFVGVTPGGARLQLVIDDERQGR
jgi:protocatechuate 3,4-dioxygenase beta subunit